MCTFKNEIAVFIAKLDMASDLELDVTDAKLSTLINRRVTLVGGSYDSDPGTIQTEEGKIVVDIYLGRFANSVLKEVFAEEIKKGFIVVSENEKDAHKKIKEYFPDNRYEFLNESIIFDEVFIQQPEKPCASSNV